MEATNKADADDIASQERQRSRGFLHRQLGSRVVAGEESDCSGKNDTGYESEGKLLFVEDLVSHFLVSRDSRGVNSSLFRVRFYYVLFFITVESLVC